MDYKTYLQSAEWQKKRNERLKIDDYKCQKCGRPFDLQVHHLTYDRIGHEDMCDLITLCKHCHARIEEYKTKYRLAGVENYGEYRQTKKKHSDNVAEFCKLYESCDYSAGGNLDLCKLKEVEPYLFSYLGKCGDAYPNNGTSTVIGYFAQKRWAIILDYINKGYPKHIAKKYLKFSNTMIEKVYADPEEYARRIKNIKGDKENAET